LAGKRNKMALFGEKKLQSGFSIMEVPIALAIIAVMLVIYTLASNTMLLNRNSRDEDLAHYIAVSEIQDLRNGGYASVPASGSFSHSLLGKLPSASASLTTSDYDTDTKQVSVTVSWLEPGSSTTHSVSLVTLISKFGL